MEPQKFFYPVLAALDEGSPMRTAWAIVLRCAGVLIALGGTYAFVEVLRLSFQAPKAEIAIAGLVLAIGILAAVAMILQVFFYRAACIRDLPASRFTVIPIFSLMLRTAGEVYAALAGVTGIAGCLFLWLAGQNPLIMLGEFGALLPGRSVEGTFLGGLIFAFTLLITAIVVLILAYFFAESIVVLADIATNMNILTHHWVPGTQSPPINPVAPVQQRKQSRDQVYSRGKVDAQPSYGGYAPQQATQEFNEPVRQEPVVQRQAPAPAHAVEAPQPAAPDYDAPPQTWPAQQSQAPPPAPPIQQNQAPPAARETRSRVRIVQRCRSCGAELSAGTNSCPNCGTAI
jgi:hypothetical protein